MIGWIARGTRGGSAESVLGVGGKPNDLWQRGQWYCISIILFCVICNTLGAFAVGEDAFRRLRAFDVFEDLSESALCCTVRKRAMVGITVIYYGRKRAMIGAICFGGVVTSGVECTARRDPGRERYDPSASWCVINDIQAAPCDYWRCGASYRKALDREY